jgi:RNA-directed DNA polymerase
MDRIGLTLNLQKTSIRNGRTEEFGFLGYAFGPRHWWKTGGTYLAAYPSKKSIKRFRASIHDLLRPQETGSWEDVCSRLNATLRGWQNYFSYGTVSQVYQMVNRYVYDRVRYFLRRRHQATPSRGYRQFPEAYVFGELGVYALRRRQR